MFALLLLACGDSRRDQEATPAIPPAEQKEVQRLVDEASARARAREDERRRALRAAIAELGPRSDLGGCPFHPRLPDIDAPRSAGLDMERMKEEIAVLERVELHLRSPDRVATASGPLFHAFTSRAESVRKGALARAREELAEIDADAYWDYDVVFVRDAETDAQKTGEGFVRGTIRGRAYLYSFADKKVACMSEFTAQSSDQVTVTETKIGDKRSDDFETAAGVDLLDNALRAALGRLVAAGPRQAPAAADGGSP